LELKPVSSSLNGINSLISGYFKKCPLAFFGPPKSGKSILCFQDGLYVAKQVGSNLLYIDTEGAGPVFLKLWEEVFRKRFSLSSTKVFYLDLRRVEDILDAHGYKTEMKISKGGKIDVIYKGDSENKIAKLIEKENIGVVVYDSMSNPLKIAFPGGRMNRPARADAIDMWLNAIHFNSLDYNLVTFVVHHRSIDPTNPFAEPFVVGGDTILYNFKVILYLSQRKYRPQLTVRDVHLYRFFNEKEWSKAASINLTEEGYFDVSQEELVRMSGRGGGDVPAPEGVAGRQAASD
jgi:hypothetical protein